MLFLLATLVVSALWHDPAGGHRVVASCCAWRATDLPQGPLLPLLGSAFLIRRPVEAVWTVAATWLVLGPLETAIGSRRLLALGAVGHALPTALVDLCWLASGRAGQGLAGLDVGTSAVVVTAAAALAVATRSLPVAAVLEPGWPSLRRRSRPGHGRAPARGHPSGWPWPCSSRGTGPRVLRRLELSGRSRCRGR